VEFYKIWEQKVKYVQVCVRLTMFNSG